MTAGTAIFQIRPFHVGWRVEGEVSGRRRQDTVVSERQRAIEIAQYHAKRHEMSRVIILREDGSVDEELLTP
jgi:hypothetical protein